MRRVMAKIQMKIHNKIRSEFRRLFRRWSRKSSLNLNASSPRIQFQSETRRPLGYQKRGINARPYRRTFYILSIFETNGGAGI